jgi:hypothetical protein
MKTMVKSVVIIKIENITNISIIEEISPYYRLSIAQVEALAEDLAGDDKTARIEACQHIGKFVLEPAKALIKYISEGDCIQTLTVSV